MSKLVDITGMKFGRLSVLRKADCTSRRGEARWECICDCGKPHIAPGYALRIGYSKSCGCLALEMATEMGRRQKRHGMSRTRTHRIWLGMHDRCNCPSNQQYSNYGGRGIKICERWHKFENFLEDMGEQPVGMSIDRENNDGNYEPGNCRWATMEEQQNNKRTNRKIEYGGEIKTLAQWERALGYKPGLILSRIRRGWSIEKALTPPHSNKQGIK